jgi:phosphomannomutase
MCNGTHSSHNPPEYNGYKVYWEDVGQIVPPEDEELLPPYLNFDQIKFDVNEDLIHYIDTRGRSGFYKVIYRKRKL